MRPSVVTEARRDGFRLRHRTRRDEAEAIANANYAQMTEGPAREINPCQGKR